MLTRKLGLELSESTESKDETRLVFVEHLPLNHRPQSWVMGVIRYIRAKTDQSELNPFLASRLGGSSDLGVENSRNARIDSLPQVQIERVQSLVLITGDLLSIERQLLGQYLKFCLKTRKLCELDFIGTMELC